METELLNGIPNRIDNLPAGIVGIFKRLCRSVILFGCECSLNLIVKLAPVFLPVCRFALLYVRIAGSGAVGSLAGVEYRLEPAPANVLRKDLFFFGSGYAPLFFEGFEDSDRFEVGPDFGLIAGGNPIAVCGEGVI